MHKNGNSSSPYKVVVSQLKGPSILFFQKKFVKNYFIGAANIWRNSIPDPHLRFILPKLGALWATEFLGSTAPSKVPVC